MRINARDAGNMLGLFLSQVILFVVAAGLGFALGWRIRAYFAAQRRRAEEREIGQLRAALSEAQVRRAR
ncbi:MAG: hypothetical protein J0L81_07540 [Caulobacterales bacterium]|nr:hypothetical protein [Caulobacterales bacterium]